MIEISSINFAVKITTGFCNRDRHSAANVDKLTEQKQNKKWKKIL